MRWNLQSNVCDVLALGPRTAGRLATVGIYTVAQLLAAKPQTTARRLAIPAEIPVETPAEIIVQWQFEAQLLVAIPQLPPLAARTFAAVGLNTAAKINRTTPTQLLAALETAQQKKPDGWLAQTTLPTIVELSIWIRAAQPTENFYAA